MTTLPAGGDPQTLHAATIGAAWLAAARRIIAEGVVTCYDGLPAREISLVTLAVDGPDPGDEVIARYGEPGRLVDARQLHQPLPGLGAGQRGQQLRDPAA